MFLQVKRLTKSWKQLDKYFHVELVVLFCGTQIIFLQVAFADKVLLNKARTMVVLGGLEGTKRCGAKVVVKSIGVSRRNVIF